ncbi:MAG: hypothetical protein JHC93_05885 [Parachlamydiales bacterium]|nr:hypothetical protein [Parachlamydiales bacterium]
MTSTQNKVNSTSPTLRANTDAILIKNDVQIQPRALTENIKLTSQIFHSLEEEIAKLYKTNSDLKTQLDQHKVQSLEQIKSLKDLINIKDKEHLEALHVLKNKSHELESKVSKYEIFLDWISHFYQKAWWVEHFKTDHVKNLSPEEYRASIDRADQIMNVESNLPDTNQFV